MNDADAYARMFVIAHYLRPSRMIVRSATNVQVAKKSILVEKSRLCLYFYIPSLVLFQIQEIVALHGPGLYEEQGVKKKKVNNVVRCNFTYFFASTLRTSDLQNSR